MLSVMYMPFSRYSKPNMSVTEVARPVAEDIDDGIREDVTIIEFALTVMHAARLALRCCCYHRQDNYKINILISPI